MKKLLTFFLLISLLPYCFAVTWVPIHKIEDLITLLDIDSIARDGDFVEVWTKDNKRDGRYSIGFIRLDCKKYTVKYHSVMIFDNGDIKPIPFRNTNMQIPNGTIANEIYKRFC